MINAVVDNVVGSGSSTALRGIFAQYREELEWVATFLTGDRRVGEACVVDACALTDTENFAFQEWLLEWAHLATVRSAAEIEKRRITQLCTQYTHQACVHGGHLGLPSESVELVVEQSGLLVTKLDVLCRFALVICGLENRPASEAALLIGVDRASVEAAYCTAVEFLAVIGREMLQEDGALAAACN